MDLSILIPARNEEYLSITVDNILKNIRGDKTEILVGLDGEWANPPIKDDPRVIILYKNESVGQRAMTNALCRLAKGKYVMKIDAHCAVDEGFDVKMIDAYKEVGDDVTMIPALYNLHAFNWKCNKCGNVWYQSPTPKMCYLPGESRRPNPKCDNKTDFTKIIVWEPRKGRRSEAYRFDTDLHFQYDRNQMRRSVGDFCESMSIQGSCFMLTREKYWELDISSEKFNSWGQQGVEVACKTWLSGGKVLTNKRTWYAHMFRTQGGDFGFPFPLKQKEVDENRKLSKDLFFYNSWEGQKLPLAWLVEKFKPLDNPNREGSAPDWHTPEGKDIYDLVMFEGDKFMALRSDTNPVVRGEKKKPTKGIIYYTDNQLNIKLAKAVQSQLTAMNLPIVSASLKPMPHFGKNIHIKLKRSVLAMFTQILTALENSDADIVFFCEHDVMYHPSHFEFTPPTKDKFYYNENVWKLDQSTGKTLHYRAKQVSGIAVYRELAVEHYRKRVQMVKDIGYSSKMGYEPGTHSRPERVDDLTSESWFSEYPNVDVRHNNNLSHTRWTKEEFRNQKYTEGWTEGNYKDIPGWPYSFFESFINL